jgi:hypothetical protein
MTISEISCFTTPFFIAYLCSCLEAYGSAVEATLEFIWGSGCFLQLAVYYMGYCVIAQYLQRDIIFP